ncbi:MAG: integrase core domain-containing protein [Limisphaerales bacterium]
MPEAIRSDNGSPFANVHAVLGLSRLSAWWLVLGIDLERNRPGCPQDNGAHERMHLDISRELEGESRGAQQASLEQWRQTFNQDRPHEALGMKCPAEAYEPSPRSYAGTPADLSYQAMARRKVSSNGKIKLGGQDYFISTALQGWSVGLEPGREGVWNVWFGRLLLGQIEPNTASFRPATEQPIDPKEDGGGLERKS